MEITFLDGFNNREEAEADLKRRVYKDKYSIASVFNIETEKTIAYFIIENKAVDVIMSHDERAHGIGK